MNSMMNYNAHLVENTGLQDENIPDQNAFRRGRLISDNKIFNSDVEVLV